MTVDGSFADDESLDRAAEVEALLAADETFLGSVWREIRAGKTAAELADEWEITTGPIYSNLGTAATLREGRIPNGATKAKQDAGRVRSWLKSKALSPSLRQTLVELEDALEARASDEGAAKREASVAVEKSKSAEASGRPGIYVYTLPHYRRYPVDPDSGKTLLKVGHSSPDAYYRAGSQGRLTALPEDPILLRIYPVVESAAAEREFHEWLRDADHERPRSQRAGAEWFVTSTKFLDRIARSKDLEVVVVNELEGDDV
ncbi:MAG: hypothetical protein ITG02_07895 [Patulibacter sp.]|nr:hypothetical protein [Patulibacter sp.]